MNVYVHIYIYKYTNLYIQIFLQDLYSCKDRGSMDSPVTCIEADRLYSILENRVLHDSM